jgi:hypothetical protein
MSSLWLTSLIWKPLCLFIAEDSYSGPSQEERQEFQVHAHGEASISGPPWRALCAALMRSLRACRCTTASVVKESLWYVSEHTRQCMEWETYSIERVQVVTVDVVSKRPRELVLGARLASTRMITEAAFGREVGAAMGGCQVSLEGWRGKVMEAELARFSASVVRGEVLG